MFGKLCFLTFLFCVSASPLAIKPSRGTDVLIKAISALPDAERTGLPDSDIDPIDPMTYNDTQYIIYDGVTDNDFFQFEFPSGVLAGGSQYTPSNFTTFENIFGEQYVDYQGTVGPITFKTNYVLSGVYNDTKFEGYNGTFEMTIKSTDKMIEVTFVQFNGTYELESMEFFEGLMDPTLTFTNLPDFVQKSVDDNPEFYLANFYGDMQMDHLYGEFFMLDALVQKAQQ